MIASTLLLATLSMSTGQYGIEQHPYDIALMYCRDKGSIAKYIDNGDYVEFSCADDMTQTIYIYRD